MPKKRRGKSESLDPLSLPVELQTALEALYGHYAKTFDLWVRAVSKFLHASSSSAITLRPRSLSMTSSQAFIERMKTGPPRWKMDGSRSFEILTSSAIHSHVRGRF